MKLASRSRALTERLLRLGFAFALAQLSFLVAHGDPHDYFAIEVLDDATGRGVPLAELTTVNSVSYWTDSNGLVVFHEPGLMGTEVFFHIRSHGYEYPKDFFGNRGIKLRPVAGGKAVMKLKRLNIAERLYRVTGEGIYRDTLLLGRRAPCKEPLLNGQVMGQDTVIATPYRGKVYWFWGDTDRPSYPLGNFGASGATSEMPGRGGLDPGAGVDLTYFVDKSGFSKPMCPDDEFGKGLKWIEGLMTLRDPEGRERLLARVAAGTGMEKTREWHLARFNDEKEAFESVVRWNIHNSHDSAHPFRARIGTNDYIYLYADYRVRADLQSLVRLDAYEAFTCLAPGVRFEGGASKLNRSPENQLLYAWREGAERLDGSRLRALVKAGKLDPEENRLQFHDLDTGRPIQLDRGSVCWNEYRQRWIMIASGLPGEIWFTEADTPLGPWVYARKIVTHDNYNFYNPTQHSFFDQDRGRVIYFEGTYTASFSGAKQKTPRYDYNQIMYRLALDDTRLGLPAPVYAVTETNGSIRYLLRQEVEAMHAWDRIESVPFLAMPTNHPGKGLIPIYGMTKDGALALEASPQGEKPPQPLFLALPVGTNTSPSVSSMVAPLFEYRRLRDGQRLYSTESRLSTTDYLRSPEPVCNLWRNPMRLLILDREAKASSGEHKEP